jgi:hypothetical protein
MSTPLTMAELVAAEALAGPHQHTGLCNQLCHVTRARAVVAALRGPLYGEVADRMLQHAQDAEDHDATESAVYTFMVAADQIRTWAIEAHPSTPR